MNLRDALFNWLQIKVVWEARPRDRSAEETTRFFWEILSKDHRVEEVQVQREEEGYRVVYRRKGEEESLRFDSDQVEQLLLNIEAEPKYNRQFGCGSDTE
ncbi:hypothetical protein C8P63_101294 [Melghirimyces profundicolus]|uniref:Uncharacterized protein n=1 Tax=Melghirimyces profundicolus TaxID=1242148 RepID=A0A2T6C9U6_9BACL|nr:hypothetical protein [Melghirimyces profundicolus]PTX65066.1 hypothetical protein C8P63_101294 [Melghirimyces profundicolus]